MMGTDFKRHAEIPLKTLGDLGFDAVRSQLAKRCSTQRGQELASALLPYWNLEESRRQSSAISEAKNLQTRGEPLSLGGISDLRELLRAVVDGNILEPAEFLIVAQTLQKGIRLRQSILEKEEELPCLFELMCGYVENNDLVESIDQAIDERGEVRDSASPSLRGLRKKINGTQTEILRKAQSLLDQPTLTTVWQERYITQREGRYVLPVRAEARVAVRGIVQDSSTSGATVFMEPEPLIELNNQWKLAQLELAAEIHRILQELSQQMVRKAIGIESNLKLLAELDLVCAAARLSVELKAHPLKLVTDVATDGQIMLRAARHPLLLLGGGEVIANDIILGHGQAMVLSGPNAGGKTVALKLTGLFLLLARAGLHCSVEEGSYMPAYQQVLTDIGDDQSLERNVSTFSAHIQNLCQFLKISDAKTLVLLDEVAVGTDPEQGAALAQALLEAFVERGATILVTTHYPSLKILAANDLRFINASVGYDLEHLQPTYRLHLGLPGPSETLPVAKKLGIPTPIVDRTYSLIHSDRIGIEALLRELTKQKEHLAETQKQVSRLQREAEEKTNLFDALVAEARAEVQKQRRRAHDQAVFALKEARQQLEELKETLRKKKSIGTTTDDISRAKKSVEALSSQIGEMAPRVELKGDPLSASELIPGKQVYLSRLSQPGIILSKEERGKVWVQSGTLKLQIPAEEVRQAFGKKSTSVPTSKQRWLEAAKQVSDPVHSTPVVIRTAGNTIDVRGERVDSALPKIEQFLDQALRFGESAAFVIHGHGTGALKQAIRNHLIGYPGVQNLESAAQEEGGDGVTIVYFT